MDWGSCETALWGRPSQVILCSLPLHGGKEALGEGPADYDVQLPVVDHNSVCRDVYLYLTFK